MDEARLKLLQDAFKHASENIISPVHCSDDNNFPFLHSGKIFCGMSTCLGFIKINCTQFQWTYIRDCFFRVGLDILSDTSFQDYVEYDTDMRLAAVNLL